MQSLSPQHSDFSFRRYRVVIYVLIALYVVAGFSPLRLEHDSVRYFAIKDCIESGIDPQCPALADFLPAGYPLLLAGLSKTGLLNAFSIAFINAIYLLTGLLLTRKIIGTSRPVLFFVMVLLNWTCIKLFAYPLSEMQYLFFSLASLYFFHRYINEKKWPHLLLSFLLAAVATFTRNIGYTLLAALVAALVWENRKRLLDKTVLITAAIVITGLLVALLKIPGTRHYVNAFAGGKPAIPAHIQEWGQLLLNIPIGKLKNYIPAVGVNIIFSAAGIALIALFFYVLYRTRKQLPSVIICYLVLYCLVILKWPYADPRFWVPVLPLIVAVILKALPISKWTIVAFSLYALMGIAAYSFSFYTQFNKAAFARSQANGIFQKEYEAHFFGKPSTPPSRPEVLDILERYDPYSSHISSASSH